MQNSLFYPSPSYITYTRPKKNEHLDREVREFHQKLADLADLEHTVGSQRVSERFQRRYSSPLEFFRWQQSGGEVRRVISSVLDSAIDEVRNMYTFENASGVDGGS